MVRREPQTRDALDARSAPLGRGGFGRKLQDDAQRRRELLLDQRGRHRDSAVVVR